MGRVVAVLGMHRSGTSVVARGVKALGAELGNRLMPPNAAENPKGYWEDLDFVALDDQVLQAVGIQSWSSVRLVEPSVWESPAAQELAERAVALIAEKFGDCPLWGFKDPRSPRLLPFWKGVFRRAGLEAGYVLVVRNPISVARSLAARNGMPAEKAHLLWLEHMLPAFLETVGAPRVVVDFDLLMASPEAQLERVAARLALPLTAPVRAQIGEFARHFLAGELRHTVFGADDVQRDPAVPLVARKAFPLFSQLAGDAVSPEDPQVLAALRGIAQELEEIAPLCRLLDDQDAAHENAQRELAQAGRALQDARDELAQARQESAQARQESARAQQESARARLDAESMQRLRHEALEAIDVMRGSLSWRVTAPLRHGDRLARTLLRADRPVARHGTGGTPPAGCPNAAPGRAFDPEPGAARGAARAPRHLLMVDAVTPTPDEDAGSVDVVSYMRIFRSLGYAVTFVAEQQLQHCGEDTTALQGLGVECLYEPHVHSIRSHLEACGDRYGLVMLYRAPTAARHIDDVRRCCPRAAVIFNTVDLHYLREERQAALEGSEELARGAAQTKASELSVIARADCTIVLNTAEQAILAREPAVRGKRVVVMPLIVPVPGRTAPFAGRRDIVFVGGFRHQPNVDAVAYFTREVWPLIGPRIPGGCRFLIVGSHAPEEVLALQGDGIQVAGHVEDLAPLFARCRLSVAPIRFGAGMKGKVLTSMAHGVPCVATTIAVEGGEFRHEQNVLVADAPEAFAAAVARAYGDEELWNRLSRNGLRFVEQGYSLEAGRGRIEQLLAELS